jgi:hypothetical protein
LQAFDTPMKKNVIILTHGWTGSSVFTALFGLGGYWLGSETVQKVDYNTFENSDLVALNTDLISKLAVGLNHQQRFAFEDVSRIEQASKTLDLQPYRDFVSRCSENGLWVWKDPRLTWTIRVWARVLDLEKTAFLILTRDEVQAWISSNTRRHVQSFRFTRQYNNGITSSNTRFLEEMHLPFMRASFEDLLLEPQETIARLNDFFALELALDDLRSVYREPLYQKSRNWKDLVLAAAIYAKNYGHRDFRGRST